MVAVDCTLRDDWTLVCIPIPVLATQILSKSFCVFVVIGAVIFALYGISLYYSRRPFCRILSFGCLVFGMQLCLPQVWLESLDPTYMASSNLPLYVLFAIGDVVAHVGLMMLVYWDICMEAVLLIYALAPLHQRIGYKVSTWVGAMSVASQVLFLIPFWTLMYYLPIGSTRNFIAGTFFVVQCFTIFGIIPAAGFAVLAHGVRKLRGKLPASIPRHLTHRLRFTQLGIAIFILMGVADALFALIPATQPYVRRFSSFLYINLVLTSLAIFTCLLLAVEPGAFSKFVS